MTKVWKGMVQFGLVSIPVYLTTAARDEHVSLGLFHAKCATRIKRPDFCPTCNTHPMRAEIERGYETGEGGYVHISEVELEGIAPASERVLEITDCVRWSDVDPVYLAESFHVLPDDVGRKAYAVLLKALESTGRVAIGQITKNSREHVVLLRPRKVSWGTVLMAHFLYYGNEVAAVPEAVPEAKLSPEDIKLARQLVESLASNFKPQRYEDGYQARLNALIASKLDSRKPAPTPIRHAEVPVIDLMAALKASIAKRQQPAALPAKARGKKGAA